jgi:hypothetical protein
MVRTLIHLQCDSCGGAHPDCEAPSPLDGAIFTHSDLRRAAKRTGWTRRMLKAGIHRDLCPACTKKAGKR